MVDAMGTVAIQERTAAEKVAAQARESEGNEETEEAMRKEKKKGNDCIIS